MTEKVLKGDLDWAGIAEKDRYLQSRDHENVKAGKVHLPGGVAVGRNGGIYVSGPVFGPGGIMKVG